MRQRQTKARREGRQRGGGCEAAGRVAMDFVPWISCSSAPSSPRRGEREGLELGELPPYLSCLLLGAVLA